MKYVGTFGSGFQTVIKDILTSSNIKIDNIYDGFVIFESNNLDLKNIHCFNNIYLLLDSIKIKTNNIDNNISLLIKNLRLDFNILNNILSNIKHHSFKIKALDKNNPVKINYNNIIPLENIIKKNTSMKIENNPDIDFIFMQRSEGYLYFLMKLTYNRKTEKDLKQGSLRPEICYLLSKMANIEESDIILDPFCGYGSIPREIVKHFKYNMIFASDIDEDKITFLKKEYKNNNKKLFIKVVDSLKLDKYDDNFIDVIITDPPWNIYNESNDNYEEFYSKMLKEFNRVLKDTGRIVLLMGNINDFENALNKTNLFKIDNKLSVLINGKKANVYLLTK